MTVTAAQIKTLRELTGAGLMECKKALENGEGDIQKAVEFMRKSGLIKAAKKSARTAAEGLVFILAQASSAVMLEVNCETDFVAKNTDFMEFVRQLAESGLKGAIPDLETLLQTKIGSGSVEEARIQLIAKLGENISIRRYAYLATSDKIGFYTHNHKIGVLVEMNHGAPELIKDIAMHIAASRPQAIQPEDISPELIQKEKEIFMAEASRSGKPEAILQTITEGKLKKFLEEQSLLTQAFIKNSDTKVGDLLKAHDAKVKRFLRFEVGEGIEKEETDFKKEVMELAR